MCLTGRLTPAALLAAPKVVGSSLAMLALIFFRPKFNIGTRK